MSRRTVAASGAAVVLAYVALALASAGLSPLAGGPMLDGLGPLAPYRWVDPPPELAATNQAPSSGRFDVTLGPQGSEAATFVLSDNQATFILPAGVFAPQTGQDRVRLRVDPVDPASLGPAPDGMAVFGNAYRLRATYQPGGRPVEPVPAAVRAPVRAPTTSGQGAGQHNTPADDKAHHKKRRRHQTAAGDEPQSRQKEDHPHHKGAEQERSPGAHLRHPPARPPKAGKV